MKQSIIENFDPNDLHKFLMQSARENFDENCNDFNAGMAMLMALVKKYFCDDFDISIRDNNGWISVEDDNPTTNDFVFVLRFGKFPALGKYINNVWHAQALGSHYVNNMDGYHVTHWQPIPESPKE